MNNFSPSLMLLLLFMLLHEEIVLIVEKLLFITVKESVFIGKCSFFIK